ncbi:MAG: glycosyltransferase [bacterium]
MATISIIIPTYNAENFLPQAINSVVEQTYQDIEIIVVDDGSTDNTKRIIEPFMDKIYYIYKDNGGPASARNVGIKSSKGEYIAFLDADDIWLPQKLELQINLFQQCQEIDWIHTNLVLIDESGNVIGIRKLTEILSGSIFKILFMENWVLTSSVMMKRECLKIIGNFDETLSVNQDYDLWLRLSHYYKCGYLEQPLVKYRIHHAQNTKKIERLFFYEKAVIEKTIQNFPEIAGKSKLRYGKLYFKWGCRYFEISELQEARKKFKTALSYQHLNPKYIIYYLSCLFNLPQIIWGIRWIKKRIENLLSNYSPFTIHNSPFTIFPLNFLNNGEW